MLEILEKIVAGNGTMADLELLEDISDTVKHTALCGLGKTAANPVLSTLKFFRDEYEAHVVDKVCVTKTCKGMIRLVITDGCRGCGRCARICPVSAISGQVKTVFQLDPLICIRCGACVETCPFGAIKEA